MFGPVVCGSLLFSADISRAEFPCMPPVVAAVPSASLPCRVNDIQRYAIQTNHTRAASCVSRVTSESIRPEFSCELPRGTLRNLLVRSLSHRFLDQPCCLGKVKRGLHSTHVWLTPWEELHTTLSSELARIGLTNVSPVITVLYRESLRSVPFVYTEAIHIPFQVHHKGAGQDDHVQHLSLSNWSPLCSPCKSS